MKILITEISEDWQKEYLSSRLDDELVFTDEQLSVEVAQEQSDTEILGVFIGSPVTTEILEALPDLKYVTTRSTGFDHVDLEGTRERDIPVSNVPFYGENTVAEHTMALLLALARNLPQGLERTEDARFDYEGLRGWDLKGKRIGIIGGGHIGMHVARMCKGFEMEVVVYDINQDPELAERVGFEYVELPELLESSDVVSLHLPLNKHTEHILDTEEFAQMKDGVYILNTARGGLINTEALVKALREGKVAGAGLDVLEGEEFFKDELNLIGNPEYKENLQTLLEGHLLMEMENVIVTPHNAFNSKEALERILDTTVENIKAFKSGQPQNVVNNLG